MTPEREADIRARAAAWPAAMADAADLLAEIDRLRRLPVIATCGECGWHRDLLGGRDCTHERGRGVIGAVAWNPEPPEWCPLRGAR